jgi:glycosyltransferase involved in cell wall biosynthesis
MPEYQFSKTTAIVSYPDSGVLLTVFVGVFNGSGYLESLLEQIRSQSDQNFCLVICDNDSTDNSWEILSKWPEIFPGRITLSRSSKNYGGAGNLMTNLDEIKTPWFTSMHQDDFYRANHIATLNSAIQRSSDGVVAICTSMGSINSEGIRLGSPPRAAWFFDSQNMPGVFLQNVRIHSLPIPATAYRSQTFRDVASNWHTTFFDALVTLKLSCIGEFRLVMTETMYYRENPKSESHSVDKIEELVGVGVGLVKVFTSGEFLSLLDHVAVNNRESFTRTLNEAIDVRMENSPLGSFVKLVANEIIMCHWSYSEKVSVSVVREGYQSTKQTFTSSLLATIGIKSPTDSRDTFANLSTPLNLMLQQLLKNEGSNSKISKPPSKVNLQRLYSRYGASIPFWIRRRFLIVVVKILRKKENSAWDFRWK